MLDLRAVPGLFAALDARHVSLAQIAVALSAPLDEVAVAAANQYWLWGEGDKGLALLEPQLERQPSHPLQMAYLRCLMASGRESKAALKHAVAGLQATLRKRVRDGARKLAALVPSQVAPDARLRLGFVCTYSHLKPVEFSLVPLFRELDRRRFHTTFFSVGQSGHPALDEVCDEHVTLLDANPAAAAQAIAARRIDLLFDLNGILREDLPVEIFEAQPAPLQAGWWNTPVSCGLDTVQRYFMDRTILEPHNDDLFTETIVAIPGRATLTYELPDTYPLTKSPCAHGAEFVFASFTATFKLNDVVLATWADVLRRAPRACLLIKAAGAKDPRFVARIGGIMDAHGVASNRVFLDDVDTFDTMMGCYEMVDLCLNTFNYGAGTTALNALWQGVPTLSFPGELQYARGTASMMRDCGLEDFVVASREDYIEAAVRFAHDPRRVIEVRPLVRAHARAYSTWLNPARFARNFEAACSAAWSDFADQPVRVGA